MKRDTCLYDDCDMDKLDNNYCIKHLRIIENKCPTCFNSYIDDECISCSIRI